MKSRLNWNNKTIEIQIIIRIVRVSEHFSKMLVLSGVFNTRILDARNYVNQDYMHVSYTLIVVYSMRLVTGSHLKNVSCFYLDMAQLRSLIGQSLCNAIYWSNMDFRVYWCSRWNGRIELHYMLMESTRPMALVPSLTGLVPSKIPFTFSICQGHAQLRWPWKWVPYNFLMSSPAYTLRNKGFSPTCLEPLNVF
jgi:hypothetical protein